ncbi:hypothetical protein [Flavobacterium rhizosphaerae]|uniref:Tail protein n=1 Tax=Flavobacterium rhizosphaerae TaxID=3163298 RepID=A0ABW8Z0A7_9FLAO
MSVILYINGYKIDLYSSEVIAQTKQVNTIADLNTRQTNYTDTFKVPKTANNVKAFEYMAMTGNTTLLPYKKNECSLYSHSGECFVYKGWAHIKDDGENYEIDIQDGIVDIFKAMENDSLSVLDLSDLIHQKTIENIKETWQGDLPYLYILADYNGNTGLTNTSPENLTPEVNIDYLVPSVNVKWLWDKISEKYNFNYTGAVFNTFNFKQLYMTFPKGQTVTGENDHVLFLANGADLVTLPGKSTAYWYAQFDFPGINELASTINDIHMQVEEAATYRIKITGYIYGYRDTNYSIEQQNKFYLGKNFENSIANYAPEFFLIADDVPNGQIEFDIQQTFTLEQLETVCVVTTRNTAGIGGYFAKTSDSYINITLYRVDPNTVDFSEAFTDFSVKDFLKEVLYRFGLTMYKSKYADASGKYTYDFLTLEQMLRQAETVDWSNKFNRKIKETHAYGNFAQQNWFRYNYNDKEATNNDGAINIDNVYLNDTADAIKSKIYSPEREKVQYIDKQTNVYKLWDKEIVDNPAEGEEPVKYKALDKRYYFMRAVQEINDINLISNQLSLTDTADSYYRESFYKLSFKDIIQDYYSPIASIINRAIIVDCEMWLTELDTANFDFKKLYYIEQLSNYFIVNKINSFVPGKMTKVELIRVVYSTPLDLDQYGLVIVGALSLGDNQYQVTFQVNNYTVEEDTYLLFEASDDGFSWEDTNNPTQLLQGGTVVIDLTGYPQYYIRITDSANIYSNVFSL